MHQSSLSPGLARTQCRENKAAGLNAVLCLIVTFKALLRKRPGGVSTPKSSQSFMPNDMKSEHTYL